MFMLHRPCPSQLLQWQVLARLYHMPSKAQRLIFIVYESAPSGNRDGLLMFTLCQRLGIFSRMGTILHGHV